MRPSDRRVGCGEDLGVGRAIPQADRRAERWETAAVLPEEHEAVRSLAVASHDPRRPTLRLLQRGASGRHSVRPLAGRRLRRPQSVPISSGTGKVGVLGGDGADGLGGLQGTIEDTLVDNDKLAGKTTWRGHTERRSLASPNRQGSRVHRVSHCPVRRRTRHRVVGHWRPAHRARPIGATIRPPGLTLPTRFDPLKARRAPRRSPSGWCCSTTARPTNDAHRRRVSTPSVTTRRVGSGGGRGARNGRGADEAQPATGTSSPSMAPTRSVVVTLDRA